MLKSCILAVIPHNMNCGQERERERRRVEVNNIMSSPPFGDDNRDDIRLGTTSRTA